MVTSTQINPSTLVSSAPDTSILSYLNWKVVVGFILFCLIIGLFILFLAWIFIKITKWFQDDARSGKDLEFAKYKSDLRICKINSDKRYIKRRWWTLFIFKKHAPIYIYTLEGRRYIGKYFGEGTKKEGYFILSLLSKKGFFTREFDIIVLPSDLKKSIIKKNCDFSIDLECEGIDEVLSSEFFYIPVIKNKNLYDKKFIDYSDKLMREYWQVYTHRNVMKDLSSEYKESIKEAVEINPNVQIDRKTTSNLKQ